MKHNMGRTERVVRTIAGFALFFLGWAFMYGLLTWMSTAVGAGVVGLSFVLIGTVLLLTALFAYCPVSAIIAHNSCQACKLGETHRHMPV
ncbi:MAG: DUF2892 domain-containing protein [Nitrospirae bacterium]|nr:DUF2892 domain-containing protein [Nitrospirota bacterium]MBI5695134.1 DUF2892 domain-containing protein [Nitrospirota bacterium]